MIVALRNGDRLLIDFLNLRPDLKTEWTDENTFNTNLMFKREEWLKYDNYMKFVKESENHGIAGLNPGHYIANKDFSLNFRTACEEESEVSELLQQLPHSEEFKCIIIQ